MSNCLRDRNGYEQLSGREPLCVVAGVDSRQGHHRRKDHWTREEESEKPCCRGIAHGSHHSVEERQLPGRPVAHSPQAKGRVERSFQTAQDRLVKGLRVAQAKTLDQANRYLETEFLPWWNQHLKVVPKNSTDAHRPLHTEHDLAASLSLVETRQVTNDYTIRLASNLYQIAPSDIRTGLRGANVRVESRLDGSLKVRFQRHYLSVSLAVWQPTISPIPASLARRRI